MKIAITGTSGRLGRALADRLADRHHVIELPRASWDLEDQTVASRLQGLDFEVLLHPAAMTSLEACEDAPETASRVNAEMPGELARRCAETGRRMIHFSTDYVLSGERAGLHAEDAPTGPTSVYARSKLEGERRVMDHGGCVMRVSWIFGPERPAFPDQVIDRALAGEPLAAIADKTSLPSYTKDLAEWVGQIVESGVPHQIIHACNSGEPVSWHDMACEILDLMIAQGHLSRRPEVVAQSLSEMEAFRADRPRHTAMATERLAAWLGQPPRPWREALREHATERLISR